MSTSLPMELNDREKNLLIAMFFTNKDALNYDKDEFAAMAGFKNAESARVTIRGFKKKLTDYFAGKASGELPLPATPATAATKRKAPTSTGGRAKKAVKTETPSKTGKDDVKVEQEDEDNGDAATGALDD